MEQNIIVLNPTFEQDHLHYFKIINFLSLFNINKKIFLRSLLFFVHLKPLYLCYCIILVTCGTIIM